MSCAFHRIEARLVVGFGTSPGNIRIFVDHGALCLALLAVCEASVSQISANILSRDFCEQRAYLSLWHPPATVCPRRLQAGARSALRCHE